MSDLDTLRPEVAAAIRTMSGEAGGNLDDAYDVIEAELLRLAEYEQAAGRLAIEKAEFRQHAEQYAAELAAALKANRDCVDHFEQMQAELAESRETIKRLNRRVQVAEAGVAKKVKASGGSLGRALANAAADRYMRERDEAQAELAALRARRDGSRHVFLGPNMDRITFLAEDIGPVGEYALVKVEE